MEESVKEFEVRISKPTPVPGSAVDIVHEGLQEKVSIFKQKQNVNDVIKRERLFAKQMVSKHDKMKQIMRLMRTDLQTTEDEVPQQKRLSISHRDSVSGDFLRNFKNLQKKTDCALNDYDFSINPDDLRSIAQSFQKLELKDPEKSKMEFQKEQFSQPIKFKKRRESAPKLISRKKRPKSAVTRKPYEPKKFIGKYCCPISFKPSNVRLVYDISASKVRKEKKKKQKKRMETVGVSLQRQSTNLSDFNVSFSPSRGSNDHGKFSLKTSQGKSPNESSPKEDRNNLLRKLKISELTNMQEYHTRLVEQVQETVKKLGPSKEKKRKLSPRISHVPITEIEYNHLPEVDPNDYEYDSADEDLENISHIPVDPASPAFNARQSQQLIESSLIMTPVKRPQSAHPVMNANHKSVRVIKRPPRSARVQSRNSTRFTEYRVNNSSYNVKKFNYIVPGKFKKHPKPTPNSKIPQEASLKEQIKAEFSPAYRTQHCNSIDTLHEYFQSDSLHDLRKKMKNLYKFPTRYEESKSPSSRNNAFTVANDIRNWLRNGSDPISEVHKAKSMLNHRISAVSPVTPRKQQRPTSASSFISTIDVSRLQSTEKLYVSAQTPKRPQSAVTTKRKALQYPHSPMKLTTRPKSPYSIIRPTNHR